MNDNIDFNSAEFTKEVKHKQKHKSTKKIDVSGFPLHKAKNLLKNNVIQIGIFLLCYLAVSGLVGNIILLFSHPIYFFGCIAIAIPAFILLKKKISKIKF